MSNNTFLENILPHTVRRPYHKYGDSKCNLRRHYRFNRAIGCLSLITQHLDLASGKHPHDVGTHESAMPGFIIDVSHCTHSYLWVYWLSQEVSSFFPQSCEMHQIFGMIDSDIRCL
jgi:hypothetical protein